VSQRRRSEISPSPLRLSTVALVGLLLAAGCGSRTYETDARKILDEAKATVDRSDTLHFHITSDGAGGVPTYLVGGDGDAKRPDGFTGTLNVVALGLPFSIGIVSTGGVFYVRLPFTTTFRPAHPSDYGFADPAGLIDREHGVTSLLADPMSATLADRERIEGVEVYEIDITVSGDQVKALLADVMPETPVKGRVAVDVDSHRVVRVVLTAPFTSERLSTYTLSLSNYGETVSISPPAPPG